MWYQFLDGSRMINLDNVHEISRAEYPGDNEERVYAIRFEIVMSPPKIGATSKAWWNEEFQSTEERDAAFERVCKMLGE